MLTTKEGDKSSLFPWLGLLGGPGLKSQICKGVLWMTFGFIFYAKKGVFFKREKGNFTISEHVWTRFNDSKEENHRQANSCN